MQPTALQSSPEDLTWMRKALRLAMRGYGGTSPNPMVGAVLVRDGTLLGEGWHRRAGAPHAEVEAIQDALAHGHSPADASLYVTLEPCSTHGRTPPCTEAIVRSGISRVIAGATDPNPAHAGRGFDTLIAAGVQVDRGIAAEQATLLNEAFNHWIVRHRPFVTVKAAMSLDGKIATASGESRWITSPRSRAYGMRMRRGMDAILVGVNTIVWDDPKLTVRRGEKDLGKRFPRFILDAQARIPLHARVCRGGDASSTTIVVAETAAKDRVSSLADCATVLVAPCKDGRIDLAWLLDELGRNNITSLLVEGGGEVNASFLMGGFAQRIAFFYAPRIIGGHASPGAVGGSGVVALRDALRLREPRWRALGEDLLLTARMDASHASSS